MLRPGMAPGYPEFSYVVEPLNPQPEYDSWGAGSDMWLTFTCC
jgi:hypothetical protein